jgi:hypothetical protein
VLAASYPYEIAERATSIEAELGQARQRFGEDRRAVHGAPELGLDRRGAFGDLVRVRCRQHVDPVSEDDVLQPPVGTGCLGQNPAHLPRSDDDVVGPLDRGRQTRAFLSASAQATPAVSVTLDAAATPVPPSGTPMSARRSTAEM